MNALTVKQPWAWLIAHGIKDVENRPKRFPPAQLGQWIALHVSVTPARPAVIQAFGAFDTMPGASMVAMALDLRLDPFTGSFADRQRVHQAGRIVGRIRIDKCEKSASPWAAKGFCHWQIGAVELLPDPTRVVRGQLGLWAVPPDIAALWEV